MKLSTSAFVAVGESPHHLAPQYQAEIVGSLERELDGAIEEPALAVFTFGTEPVIRFQFPLLYESKSFERFEHARFELAALTFSPSRISMRLICQPDLLTCWLNRRKCTQYKSLRSTATTSRTCPP